MSRVNTQPGCNWALRQMVEDDAPAGIARWWDHPEARAILEALALNPPALAEHRRVYYRTHDDYIRYLGAGPARLEAIRDQYECEAMGRCDHAAFYAQRPVAWVIYDRLTGRLSAAPAQRVAA
ncbi:hypothetical protein GVO57_11045 [Sphingomonas changnyeongensis]|uniref:Uncharacterized protein n=1 Tax=Sphingomonas changnyeongensis TaxID=2698679 RepID=A0A7Z2NWR0_9SPHN|nr:hypothetical protein [Sphingomonas changnyeongensis]QHL91248.1 hypothetical protein GVO57_11045 [Sphingomonas changnyeongensis]